MNTEPDAHGTSGHLATTPLGRRFRLRTLLFVGLLVLFLTAAFSAVLARSRRAAWRRDAGAPVAMLTISGDAFELAARSKLDCPEVQLTDPNGGVHTYRFPYLFEPDSATILGWTRLADFDPPVVGPGPFLARVFVADFAFNVPVFVDPARFPAATPLIAADVERNHAAPHLCPTPTRFESEP